MLNNDPHKFLNHTNIKHLNIKFTCKIESSSKLPFPDILIIKDEFQYKITIRPCQVHSENDLQKANVCTSELHVSNLCNPLLKTSCSIILTNITHNKRYRTGPFYHIRVFPAQQSL